MSSSFASAVTDVAVNAAATETTTRTTPTTSAAAAAAAVRKAASSGCGGGQTGRAAKQLLKLVQLQPVLLQPRQKTCLKQRWRVITTLLMTPQL